MRMHLSAALASCILTLAWPAPARPQGARSPSATGYWASSTCAICHPRTVEQHMQSRHESSFSNPVFQAQYFEELLPKASRDAKLQAEARSCTACHAPVAFAFKRTYFSGAMPTDPSMSGVTCDLCHTISAYEGPEPRNGNFVSSPSEKKLGPFPSETNWHHAYSALQTKSEFCATCHEAVNHNGVVVKATFSEWKKSAFRAEGVQCQDCHMTRDGFLLEGQSRHDSGTAAEGSLIRARSRDKLYTHKFPGGYALSQVEGAIGVAFEKVPERARPGEALTFSIAVNNQRTGHKMPTGSTDLRLLWLEVTARAGTRTWPVPLKVKALGGYAVAGTGEWDGALLGQDVPAGARIYRQVFWDDRNEQTLASYEATRSVWDNRLEAGERRIERYDFDVPLDAAGPLRFEARLVYLAYPSAFAKRMDVAAAKPTVVATTTADVALTATGPLPPAVPRGGPK